MQSKTSCYNLVNPTLFRRNLSRFWPLWAIYGAIWLYLGPGRQFILLFGAGAGEREQGLLRELAADILLNTAAESGFAMAVVFGCLFAMALYSYLYTARSVGMMHSFPIRRSGLFLTSYLTGCAVAGGTLAVSALLAAAVQGAAGVLNWTYIAEFFLCTGGEMLFFFSFAVFCAMFTGQLLAVPVFYGIWNVLVMGFSSMVELFCQEFLYGYRAGNEILFGLFSGWGPWLTPVVKLDMSCYVLSEWHEGMDWTVCRGLAGLGTVGVYALAGLVLAGLAFLLYRRRRSESAGDTVSVGWAKQLFRFGLGLGLALTAGQYCYWIVWGTQSGYDTPVTHHSLAAAGVSMVFFGLVGFYGAEMLLRKSFRVFRRTWKGAVLMVVLVLSLVLSLGLDVFHVADRVPDPAQVRSADFVVSGSLHRQVSLTDPAFIQRLTALHQIVLEERPEEKAVEDGTVQELLTEQSAGIGTVTIRIIYDLADGGELVRRYSLPYALDGAPAPGSAMEGLVELLTDPAFIRQDLFGPRAQLSDEELIDSVVFGEMEYAAALYSSGDFNTDYCVMDNAQARAVMEGLLRDIAAGRCGLSALYPYEDTYLCSELRFYMQNEGQDHKGMPMARPETNGPADWERYDDQWDEMLSLSISPAYTETVEALERTGVMGGTRPLLTARDKNELLKQHQEALNAPPVG